MAAALDDVRRTRRRRPFKDESRCQTRRLSSSPTFTEASDMAYLRAIERSEDAPGRIAHAKIHALTLHGVGLSNRHCRRRRTSGTAVGDFLRRSRAQEWHRCPRGFRTRRGSPAAIRAGRPRLTPDRTAAPDWPAASRVEAARRDPVALGGIPAFIARFGYSRFCFSPTGRRGRAPTSARRGRKRSSISAVDWRRDPRPLGARLRIARSTKA